MSATSKANGSDALRVVRDAIRAALRDVERERVEAVVLLALADDGVDDDATIERVATGVVSEEDRRRHVRHWWYAVPFGAFDDNEVTAMCTASDAIQVMMDQLEDAANGGVGRVR